METNVIYNEECLQGMSERIPDNSIDMILADLPYGTTACKWDSIIPLEPLWEQYRRIVKDDTAIVLTASQPFTTKLIQSNMDWFKYTWIWIKEKASNFQLAKKRPMKKTEDIAVFYKKQPTYNPQGLVEVNREIKNNSSKNGSMEHLNSANKRESYMQEYTNYPTNMIQFNNEKGLHESQKPVDLFEYLIKTYTNKGDIVLDNVIGSGTTAVAAKALGRKYIGFEQDEEYYEVAVERTREVQKELTTQQ